MKTEQIASEELLEEKSLFQVYCVARSIPVSRLNQGVSGIGILLLGLFVWMSPDSAHQLAERVRALSDYGFSFATSILSFLIAGFTIYLTVTRVDLLILMASVRHSASGLPWVKYVSFSFLRIMASYVAYCLACLTLKIFTPPGGLVTLVIDDLAAAPEIKLWIARAGLVVMGGATIHLVLLLQSFIFNIHNMSVTVLCMEMEDRKRRAEEGGGEAGK